ncbi:MAG TPA: hypothetical protein H9991_11980 [Candidatus Mailhella excrementigallinarum]|nr:hypothetical protein [Candidatus Mailhella excrementigallinarum]
MDNLASGKELCVVGTEEQRWTDKGKKEDRDSFTGESCHGKYPYFLTLLEILTEKSVNWAFSQDFVRQTCAQHVLPKEKYRQY